MNPNMMSFMFHCSYEQSHFTVALSGRTSFWWMGLRAQGDMSGGVNYVWDNGLPLTFTHWDKDQPGTKTDCNLAWKGTCTKMRKHLLSFFIRQWRWYLCGYDNGTDWRFLGWQTVLREVRLHLWKGQTWHHSTYKGSHSSSISGLRWRLDGFAPLPELLQGDNDSKIEIK